MILKVPEHIGYEVRDANDEPLKYVTWCDTETGEAVHIVTPIEWYIDEQGESQIRKVTIKHPAPLTYRKIG